MLRPGRRIVGSCGLAAAVALAAALGGCADLDRSLALSPGPVDARSPVAPEVRAAMARNYPYPSFRDVPAKPADVRSAAAFKEGVVEKVGERRGLKGWVGDNPPMTGGTEAFAAETRAEIPAAAIAPIGGPASTAETEAYAAGVRQQAAAPPPPQ